MLLIRIFSLQLVSFKKFKSTAEAVEGVSNLTEGKLNKTIKKLLKGKVEAGENLAVGDAKLGNLLKVFYYSFHKNRFIQDKLEVPCVHNSAINELMRGIRAHVDSLLGEHKQELSAMNLAVAHSLGRYKVKFNPEKIDTMIVQVFYMVSSQQECFRLSLF